jgi:hypothetical protein
MYFPRPVANLATGIFEMGCLLETDKTAGLAVTGGVTGIASLDFFGGKIPPQSLYAGKGFGFLGIGDETRIFIGMTFLAGIRANVDGLFVPIYRRCLRRPAGG